MWHSNDLFDRLATCQALGAAAAHARGINIHDHVASAAANFTDEDRSRIEALAAAHGLTVQELPAPPGSADEIGKWLTAL